MFDSKQQLNQITALISSALQTNLAKTRHKVAGKLGFKSYESLYSSLQDSKNDSSNEPSAYIEDFPKNYLTCMSAFEHVVIERGVMTEIEIQTTKEIHLLFQGYTFKDASWPLKKLSVYRHEIYTVDFEDNKKKPVTIMSAAILPSDRIHDEKSNEDFGFNINKARAHYYGTFVQHLDPSILFIDKKMLLENRDFCLDLILFGSIQQYNFFCEHTDIVIAHELENELLVRYISELTYCTKYELASKESFTYDITIFDAYKKNTPFCVGDTFLIDSVNCITHLNTLTVFMPQLTSRNTYTERQVLLNLKTPPVELVDLDFFECFMKSQENDPYLYFTKHLLPLDPYHFYGSRTYHYDSKLQFNKKHVPSHEETAIVNHGNWIMRILCKLNQQRDFVYTDVAIEIIYLLMNNKTDLKSAEIKSFLMTLCEDFHALDVNAIFYALENNEFIPDEATLPFIAFLCFAVCYKQLSESPIDTTVTQYLLSEMDDSILDLHFDLTVILRPDDEDPTNHANELIKHKTARAMLIHTLKSAKKSKH